MFCQRQQKRSTDVLLAFHMFGTGQKAGQNKQQAEIVYYTLVEV